MRPLTALVLPLLALTTMAADPAVEAKRESSVGMPARIEQLVLPGSELEAAPIESRKVPIVLRVVASYPHGTAFRYDLEYYGLDPGQYDLRDYLQRKDGTGTDDLPPLPVEIVSLLPPGQVEPNALESQAAPRLGGYQMLLTALVVLWLAGLAALLLVRRRARLEHQQAEARPLSLAERLQPLVTGAVEGRLDRDGQAELERLLLTFWRKRLGLEDTDPREAIVVLREHAEAGVLLRQVESWLHKPGGAGEVDVAAVLAPYRDLPHPGPEEAPAAHQRQTAAEGVAR